MKLINIAKMSPKQASALCSIAHSRLSPIQIAGLPLPEVIRRFGAAAAAQTPSTGFQDNRTNSKGPDGQGVIPDKQVPISEYPEEVQGCIKQLTDLYVDESRAREECLTQYGGQGYKGGKWYTSAAPKGNPINAVVHQNNRQRIAVRGASIKNSSDRINEETRNYYSRGKTMNASVSSNEVTTPSWIVVSGGDTSHLHNTSSSIRSASVQDQLRLYEMLHETQHIDNIGHVSRDPQMEALVHERGEQLAQATATRRIKSGKKEPVDDRPAWLVCMED